MKINGFYISVLMLACLICSKPLDAQKTYQYELTATATEGLFPCGVIVNGYFTYHVTYHLDKAGKLTNLHCNITDQDLWNVQTHERVRVFDVANDNSGVLWIVYNTLNAFNASINANIVYDQPDGWMNDYLPSDWLTTGKAVNINFKVVGKGGVIGYWKTQILVRLNPSGGLDLNFLKGQDDFVCR